jgi:LuxR family maltose regulon positive regulatory protein
LERANLFLVPLDAERVWYRYHGLFAEAMQHQARLRLGEARLRELSLNASRWYEEHGLLGDGVEAALAAQDYGRAADLVERVVAPQLMHNEKHTLRRWLGHLPEEVLRVHPRLCFIYAGAILFTSDRHAPATRALLDPPLHMAEQAWQAANDRPRLGELMTFRSLVEWLQGDVWQSFATARQGLELLPEGETQWRGIGLVMVGAEELWAGKLHAARQTLTQARALCQATGNPYGTLDSALLLADVCARQGDLKQAARLYRQVFSEAERAPMDRDRALLRQGRALTGLAALALEWNDLEAAERDATQAGDIGRQLADEDARVHSSLVLAGMLHARGETEQAQQLLHSLVAETKQPLLLREAQAGQARLAMAGGEPSTLSPVAGQALAAAQRWAVANVQSGDDVPRIQQEQEALVVAHVLIAQGEPEAALDVLDEWQMDSRVQGRARSELQITVLQALAHAALGRQSQARQALARALALAQPEGYRRLFLDEGPPMADLLRAALPDVRGEPLVGYVRALLLAFAEEPSGQAVSPGPVPGLLIEPLSPQEQRVLRLLAAGLSNAEIAEELVVSINTVKTHVKNVYGKLDVNSREEAREAARDLKLV